MSDAPVVTPPAGPSATRAVLGREALRRVGVNPIGDWAQRWVLAAQEVLRP